MSSLRWTLRGVPLRPATWSRNFQRRVRHWVRPGCNPFDWHAMGVVVYSVAQNWRSALAQPR
eukprot:9439470-Pyramimonas_sp.AAC.1